ncbi:MAG: hypothetical protein WC607_00615 [Candidatus Micrarchaeia archaeon]
MVFHPEVKRILKNQMSAAEDNIVRAKLEGAHISQNAKFITEWETVRAGLQEAIRTGQINEHAKHAINREIGVLNDDMARSELQLAKPPAIYAPATVTKVSTKEYMARMKFAVADSRAKLNILKAALGQ